MANPTLSAFFAQTQYITVTNFNGLGIGNSEFADFDDAVDAYADAMDEGNESYVFAVSFKDGKNADVTEDALRRLAMRHHQRNPYEPLPEWIAAGELAA